MLLATLEDGLHAGRCVARFVRRGHLFRCAVHHDVALAKNHAAALRTLDATSGKAFDRAFLEHEVAFHKAVLDAVNTSLLPALKNEEARALVTRIAPAFHAHMLAAQALLDKQAK